MTRPSKKPAKRTARKRGGIKTAADIAKAFATTTTERKPFIVDAHCHTFNASDLSKVGFITEVLLDSDENLIKVIEPLVVLLVRLIARAPGFQDELDHLNTIEESRSLRIREALVQTHVDERETIDREHWANVANELRRISISSNGQERALFRAIADETYPGGVEALALTAGIDPTAALTQRIAFSSGPFARYIKWVSRLKYFRADIIRELIKTYGNQPNDVRLFVSALVDFEFWVRDKPKTSLSEQIALGARLARTFPGRIHFFVPFDPWREIAQDRGGDGSLELVKRAVTEEGFIGVKVYPPMGFAPSGNAKLDFTEVGVTDSPKFGARLDKALGSLFAWALAEDVPIMAHCNLSQETKHGFARRAAPSFWAEVLSKYRGLRLNLGHFGGQGNLGQGGVKDAADWPESIIRLMGTPEAGSLYADIGNFDMRDTSWFGKLKMALEENKVLPSRLMYGSDWMMLAMSNHYEEFLDRFRDGLRAMNSLTEAQIAAILGGNARNFLGLNPREKSRLRLEKFYSKNSIPRPDWLQ